MRTITLRKLTPARLVGLSVLLAATATAAAIVVHGRLRPGAGQNPLTEPGAPHYMPESMRAFVSSRFNPVVERLGLVGGRRSPWSYVEHVGRRSGTIFRTPVLPVVAGDLVFIPLPYGIDVNWSRNVRAAGHCRLQRHETVYELDEPAVVGAAQRPDLPDWYRPFLIRRGNQYLRLHVLSSRPGRLENVPTETPHPVPPASGPVASVPAASA